tara:strand:+ start:306 stop:707 length:402 start_codon:yes stop_codon:yes gene_type:complete
MSEELKADKLVKVLLKIRDARAELTSKFEEADGELKEQHDTIKLELLECCKQVGADSLKTAFGTVSRTVKTRYWSTDWGSMHNFCKEYDALDLLERRISQGNMKTFMRDNPDTRIPGLNADSFYDVTVRRSSK